MGEVYSNESFINQVMPELSKMNSSVLINYYNDNVLNKEYYHALKNGTFINIILNEDNFFHATGLHHSEPFLRTMYSDMTAKSSSDLDVPTLKSIIKGKSAYHHLMHNSYELNTSFISQFDISRISRFNRIHKILEKPDSIVEVTSDMVKSDGLFKKGDLLLTLTDHGKVQSVVITHSQNSNSWYVKSFLVDRPNYCRYNHLLTPENNLRLNGFAIDKSNPLEYINKLYAPVYPYASKLGPAVASDIKYINGLYKSILKFETLKNEFDTLYNMISNRRVFSEKGYSPDYDLFHRFERVVKAINLAEKLYSRDLEIEPQSILRNLPEVNEIE